MVGDAAIDSAMLLGKRGAGESEEEESKGMEYWIRKAELTVQELVEDANAKADREADARHAAALEAAAFHVLSHNMRVPVEFDSSPVSSPSCVLPMEIDEQCAVEALAMLCQ